VPAATATMLEWVDEDFDPAHFDLAAANAAVAAL
jgi:hypothetical protein